MGIRQQLTELSNRPEGNTFEVWEEADGSITATLGGSTVVVAETNPLTGELRYSAGAARTTHGFNHVRCALLGDSITARSLNALVLPPNLSSSAIAPWNVANWMVGAPFVFTQSLAVSGDTTKGVMSRIPSVHSSTQCVFVMTGTNDVNSMSAAANQGTIDSTFTTVSGYIGAGVAALVAAGKVVVISTIIPNNALTPNTDSRIQLLDRLNAYIATLASSSVFVIDGFAALWDSAQPTVRLAVSGALNADNIHPTNAGAFLFGNHSSTKTALKAAYLSCAPDINIYDEYHQVRPLFNELRRSTGGAAGTISAGSGTLADGWRCLQNAGTATFTVDATQPYTTGADYVGPVAAVPAAIDSYWQIFNITAAAASDNPRFRTPGTEIINTAGAMDGIMAGSLFFVEFDIEVTNPVNLTEVSCGIDCNFAAGTSPADQPYAGTTYARAQAGTAADSSSAATAIPTSYRALLRTPVQRVPENINATSTVSAIPYVDMKFGGAGSAVVKIGRPRIWQKSTGRLG